MKVNNLQDLKISLIPINDPKATKKLEKNCAKSLNNTLKTVKRTYKLENNWAKNLNNTPKTGKKNKKRKKGEESPQDPKISLMPTNNPPKS